jgi:aminoglycoside phosphotransferase (APT) family kinase protein
VLPAATLPRELIGIGLTAEIFAWESGRVLKLFFARLPRAKAELEFQITRALHTAGCPVPAAYDLIDIDGRTGIVLERIEGASLLKLVERQPWKFFYAARLLADLHAQIHQLTAPSELPTQRRQLEDWLARAQDFSKDLTTEQRRAAEASLALLPVGSAVCHADFHPDNILLSPRGPIIIDWTGGTRGHPQADVARTCVLFESANLPAGSPPHMHLLLACSRRLLHRAYLRRYLAVTHTTRESITRFLPIQRAATIALRSEILQ